MKVSSDSDLKYTIKTINISVITCIQIYICTSCLLSTKNFNIDIHINYSSVYTTWYKLSSVKNCINIYEYLHPSDIWKLYLNITLHYQVNLTHGYGFLVLTLKKF